MIASFRMYNATPRIAGAWRALFGRLFDALALPIEIVDHAPPAPLASLWANPQLCCAFMCGWPFAHSEIRMQAVAVPVPSLPRYAGEPRYCSEFLVRAESGWTRLEDAFGSRFGWMAENSQSGFNAPRAHLARFVSGDRPSLFGRVIGPLGTPAKSLESLRRGDVDIIALDGFYLDLLRRDDPDRLKDFRTVASTGWAPMPLLVAAPGIPASVVGRLGERLVRLHADPEWAPLLGAVLVERFVIPDVAAYGMLERLAEEARRAGYETIR